MKVRNFRQYDPKTGLLIRHKVWSSGRKALVNIVQMHEKYCQESHAEITRLGKYMNIIQQRLQQIQTAVNGIVALTSMKKVEKPKKKTKPH